jgi:type II secretory pathway component GspD/PulD (secretin)
LTDNTSFALPPVVTSGITSGNLSGNQTQVQSVRPDIRQVSTGSVLNIAPTITKDKKHVLLNIVTTQSQYFDAKKQRVEAALPSAGGGVEMQTWDMTLLPDTETATIMTRVSVPDGGTLLLGGHKIVSEIDKEAGVPILGKLPIIGALFSNKSTVRDRKILLILVKPTIMLQPEKDQEALQARATDSKEY